MTPRWTIEGNPVVDHRVAQEHPVRRPLVLGHVARHPLHHPLGDAEAAAELPLEEDLVLEDVGKLVLDEREELAVGQVDRQHHPVAHRAGEGADPFGDEVDDDVVLLERGVGLVEDERRRLLDLEVEPSREPVVGALGERDDLLELRRVGGVVVDVEVGRMVDPPVELAVLDLVLAERRVEALRRDPRRARRQHHEERDQKPQQPAWTVHTHGRLLSLNRSATAARPRPASG